MASDFPLLFLVHITALRAQFYILLNNQRICKFFATVILSIEYSSTDPRAMVHDLLWSVFHSCYKFLVNSMPFSPLYFQFYVTRIFDNRKHGALSDNSSFQMYNWVCTRITTNSWMHGTWISTGNFSISGASIRQLHMIQSGLCGMYNLRDVEPLIRLENDYEGWQVYEHRVWSVTPIHVYCGFGQFYKDNETHYTSRDSTKWLERTLFRIVF